jgi:hypothetical protein
MPRERRSNQVNYFFSRPWLHKLIGDNYRYIKEPLVMSISDVRNRFENEFNYNELEEGCFRQAYEVDDNWIVKFPISQSGVECNITEQTLYNMYKNTGRFAKCRLQDYHGIPILFMEKVSDYFLEDDEDGNQKNHYEDLPHWAHHQDGPQVGFTKKRKLVIYDYGNCIDLFDSWYYRDMKKQARALTNASR